MKIAILNDTHCGIRNSSDIFIDNAEKFYKKIFFPECAKRGVKQILHLGDYYDHRKYVNFKALNCNRKFFLDVIREKGMRMDIIPGNHDVYYKNTNDLNSLKECLGHYMNEIHIIMEPKVMEYGSLNIGLIPWICSDNFEKSMNFIADCKSDWVGAHLELNGFEMMRGIQNTQGMDHKLFKKFEMVLSGHYHVASQRDNIKYLGAQMEFFWNDAGDKKYFHVLDTETREIERIHNPYTLFEKIVYNDGEIDYNRYDITNLDNKFVKIVVLNKNNSFVFDSFVDRIQNRDIYELKIAENFNEFIGANVEDDGLRLEDTADLVDDYIDGVSTDLDKDRIKIEMRELMKEAQSMEIA